MPLNKSGINYSGKDVNTIIKEAFAETTLASRFGARVEQGFKSKYTFHSLTLPTDMQQYVAEPTTFNDINLAQKTISLGEYMFVSKMDKNSLAGTYRELNTRQGMRSESPLQDAEFVTAIVDSITQKVAENWDNVSINGDTTLTGTTYLKEIDGLYTSMNADSNVVKVSATTSAITSTNVIGELERLWASVPKELKFVNRPENKVKIAASVEICEAYAQYVAKNGGLAWNITSEAPLIWMGVELVPVFSLGAKRMFATPASNIVLVYDDANDLANLRIFDESETSANDVIGMKLNFRGGVCYGDASKVVLYR